MKINNKQKIILYVSVLFILLISLFSKNYIIPEYEQNEFEKSIDVNNNQVKIY